MIAFLKSLWSDSLLVSLCFSAAFGSPLAARRSFSSTDPERDIASTGEAFLHDLDYNDGSYGQYVTQDFKTSNASATRINMMQPFTSCDDGSYIFVSPRGEEVKHPAASIYDPRYLRSITFRWN